MTFVCLLCVVLLRPEHSLIFLWEILRISGVPYGLGICVSQEHIAKDEFPTVRH